MDKQRIRYLFERYWWLILLIITGSVLGTFAWLQRQPSIYSARAVVEVAQAEDRILNINSVKTENPAGSDYITTVAESLTGAQVLIEAAKATGLYEEVSRGGMTDTSIVDMMRGKISTQIRPRTRLIDLRVNDVDPVRAQKLANVTVAKYLDQMREQRSTISGSAGEYLRNLADRLKEELGAARKKVSEYRLLHKDVPLGEQTEQLSEDAKETSIQRLQAGANRLQLEEDLKRITEAGTNMPALLQIQSLVALPAVQGAREQLLQTKKRFEETKQTYLELHPKYGVAKQQVDFAERTLDRTLTESKGVIQAQLADTKRREIQLAEAQTNQTTGSQKLANILVPYQLLTQEAESVQKMYDTVTQRLSELGVKDPSVDKSPVYLMESAMTPVSPIWPNKKSILTRAALLGLVGACGLLFLIDRLDSSFQTVEQVESDLQLTVLAAIPDDRLETNKMGGLPMADANRSLQAEAYRTLRTSLTLLGEESQRRAILVTSALPGEGKSRTSANLAISFAQQGFSTLLIDADLRRPSIRGLFIPKETMLSPEETIGLAEHLSGLATPAEIVRTTATPNLSIVFAGRKCPQPAEVLSQATAAKFIADALSNYDRVVIDTAPINSVADTLALVPHVHYVCLVVRACRTPSREVKRALEFLGRSSAKVAGVVLNRMPLRVYGYYYNYKGDPYLLRDA